MRMDPGLASEVTDPLGEEPGVEPSSSDRVVAAVIKRLLAGHFAPGQRLIENDLARQSNVSRGSVREALKRLAAQGIVTLSRHKGACIRQITRDQVVDILRIQAMLAGLGARLAAQRIETGDNRALIEHAIERVMRHKATPEGIAFHEDRRRFYEAMVKASGNLELATIMPSLHVHLIRMQFQSYVVAALRRRQFREYRAIADAILAGDAPRAERLMHQHIENAMNEIAALPDEAFPDPQHKD